MPSGLKLFFVAMLLTYSVSSLASNVDVSNLNKAFKTNWTYTYLKAKEGNSSLMREYVTKNWFEMDARAVDAGLFRDFKIINNENQTQDDAWDFIVAVEYFGSESYSDISEKFTEIRRQHEEHVVPGFSGREAIQIVRSEIVAVKNKFPGKFACTADAYDIIKPFFGIWLETSSTSETGKPYGLLEFSINPQTCMTMKRFDALGNDGGYQSFGVYDKNSGTWIETFHTGLTFEWRLQNGNTYMYVVSPDMPKGRIKRNQWVLKDSDSFEILEQLSLDDGKTWTEKSKTLVQRR